MLQVSETNLVCCMLKSLSSHHCSGNGNWFSEITIVLVYMTFVERGRVFKCISSCQFKFFSLIAKRETLLVVCVFYCNYIFKVVCHHHFYCLWFFWTLESPCSPYFNLCVVWYENKKNKIWFQKTSPNNNHIIVIKSMWCLVYCFSYWILHMIRNK